MSSSGIGQFIPLILIFVIFYFFLIRPQQKKVKEHKIMVQNLKRGDEVITSGGIIGRVERVFDDGRLEMNISDGVNVQVVKETVQSHFKKEIKK